MEDFDKKYLDGAQNRAIRYYFYLLQGLNILNNFRNLFLGIFAVYFALKLDNIFLIVVMFIPCAIILAIAGYISVHKINKVLEWIGIRFSSHYAVRQFDYTKRQVELLEEVRDLLKKRDVV